MDQSLEYLGYVIGWQEPPLTSAGYDIGIASDDLDLQRRLEAHFRIKGAHCFRMAGSIGDAIDRAKRDVDAVLNRS